MVKWHTIKYADFTYVFMLFSVALENFTLQSVVHMFLLTVLIHRSPNPDVVTVVLLLVTSLHLLFDNNFP